MININNSVLKPPWAAILVLPTAIATEHQEVQPCAPLYGQLSAKLPSKSGWR